jgi:subtilase family serine protease
MTLRRFPLHAPLLGLLTILSVSGLSGSARAANQAGSPDTAARIVDTIDETQLVSLPGHTHPLAIAKFDQGPVPDSLPLEHMFLELRRSPEQEERLERALREIQDPHSARYHSWLKAEELGTKFGPAQQDIETVVRWLEQQGLQVNRVSRNGLTIDVSATAGQVRQIFHAQIHNYLVNGKRHIANAGDPQIPAAMAPVVVGFVALHDFMPKPAVRKPTVNFSFACNGCPDGFNGIQFYDESPADLATIYNVTPLYTASTPITGKGQTVVVLEDTDVNPADVATFRTAFRLSSYSGAFVQIHPGAGCTDPGTNAGELEAALDAEWAGAVAPDASVQLASCADTATNFGGFLAAQNLLDLANPPYIMSLSYGECETVEGPSGNAYLNGLWQQAAIEGVSVFVSAGDGGAAGCDNADAPAPNLAKAGIAANSLASTPYDVATGGTDFLDTAEGTNSTYWSTTNTSSGESAKSYVPEMTWNDSCAGSVLYAFEGYSSGVAYCNSIFGSRYLDLGAAAGAPSFVYAKPYWQTNVVGIPNDGVRDLPDVSLFASNGFWSHAVLFCMSDAAQGGAPCDYTNPADALSNSAGGTSFTAPQFASIQALINQKAGAPQGNPDPVFYSLARSEYGNADDPDNTNLSACNASQGNAVSSSCVFHDVTTGNIAEPCYGTNNCYAPPPAVYGVLSTSDTSLLEAYPATTGWDFATGLGSVNVTNLVNSWP